MRVQIKKDFDSSYGIMKANTIVSEITCEIADMQSWVANGCASVVSDDTVERGAPRFQGSLSKFAMSANTSSGKFKLADFTKFLENAAANKWGYVWGGNGKTYNEKEREYLYNNFKTNTYNYDYYYVMQWKRWKNKPVADCSGLIEAFSGQNITANDYYSRCSSKGTLSTFKGNAGYLLFIYNSTSKTMTHIGGHVGSGNVVESRDSAVGVVKRAQALGGWTHWGVPDFIDFGNSSGGTSGGTTTAFTCGRVLRLQSPMMTGTDVKSMQQKLLALGYSLGKGGADGFFGGDSDKAIRKFQSDKKLVSDGIAGKKTIEALGGKWTGA